MVSADKKSPRADWEESARGGAPTRPVPIGALLRMGQACTREEAQEQARDLLAAGADPATVADALAEWDELQAQSVREVNP